MVVARTAAGMATCGGSGPTVLTRMTGETVCSSAPADHVGAWAFLAGRRYPRDCGYGLRNCWRARGRQSARLKQQGHPNRQICRSGDGEKKDAQLRPHTHVEL